MTLGNKKGKIDDIHLYCEELIHLDSYTILILKLSGLPTAKLLKGLHLSNLLMFQIRKMLHFQLLFTWTQFKSKCHIAQYLTC